MSVFTNPADAAGDTASAYVSALLALLGEADPLAVLPETPSRLQDLIAGRPDEVLRRPEGEGKWAAVEILQHLADAEVAWAWRLRMVLTHDRAELTGYDQDRWATRLRYRQADPSLAIEQFRILRRSNLRLLDRMEPADLDRVGLHAERGEESLRHMLRLYAGHDLVHLGQLERVLRTVA